MARAEERRFPWEDEGERLTFSTPEQIEVTYRVAPFGSRVAAALLDHLLVLFLCGAALLGLLVVGPALPSPRVLAYVAVASLLATFLLQTFYFVWSELRNEGRTWGKRRLGLRTVMLSGHGLTFGAALVRNLARIVDNIPFLWLVPALTPGRRRLGDLLGGTVVVDESAGGASRPAAAFVTPADELRERRFFFTGAAQARLYPDDLDLLEHLLARDAELPLGAERERLFLSVAERYVERLAMEGERAQVEEEPRRFLQELYLLLLERYEGNRL